MAAVESQCGRPMIKGVTTQKTYLHIPREGLNSKCLQVLRYLKN